MAVHIFTVNESNYKICIQKGLVGLPEPKESRTKNNVFDGLLSRLSAVQENDYILIYVIGTKELRGLWQAEGRPFYDTNPVWPDRIYPFRCKIRCSQYYFQNALKLNDINDMRSSGKIWTWALQRSSGPNVMFSISNYEFETLMDEYMKANPFTLNRGVIREPYPVHEYNLMDQVHFENGQPKYEYSIMTLLNIGFSKNEYTEIFGNYTDYLSYVPTNLGTEMDFLLMFNNPTARNQQVMSYDIIEVKRGQFGEDALIQLIGYESWFLQKKVSGDSNMIRTTAIAKSFSDVVIDYTRKRKKFEGKPVKLLTYSFNAPKCLLELRQIL